MSLGSMSLAQYEAVQKELHQSVSMESLLLRDRIEDTQQVKTGQTDDSVEIMKKLKQMEEEFARQAAKLAFEEKKWQEAECAKKKLEMELIKQSELLKQTMEQLAEKIKEN